MNAGFFLGDEQEPITIYSYVHLIVGIGAGLLGIPFIFWLFLNLLFEALENSSLGLKATKSLADWIASFLGQDPWSPYSGDNPWNSVCDILMALLGWVIGKYLRKSFPDSFQKPRT